MVGIDTGNLVAVPHSGGRKLSGGEQTGIVPKEGPISQLPEGASTLCAIRVGSAKETM